MPRLTYGQAYSKTYKGTKTASENARHAANCRWTQYRKNLANPPKPKPKIEREPGESLADYLRRCLLPLVTERHEIHEVIGYDS